MTEGLCQSVSKEETSESWSCLSDRHGRFVGKRPLKVQEVFEQSTTHMVVMAAVIAAQ